MQTRTLFLATALLLTSPVLALAQAPQDQAAKPDAAPIKKEAKKKPPKPTKSILEVLKEGNDGRSGTKTERRF